MREWFIFPHQFSEAPGQINALFMLTVAVSRDGKSGLPSIYMNEHAEEQNSAQGSFCLETSRLSSVFKRTRVM
ncbi:hypothetical protein RB195_017504 [Necator americanus]|uniref:Uncharacterized protein n=1 Tax=Necator americanus TaxID=51031 RepID=A0ABR1C975_NECAM